MTLHPVNQWDKSSYDEIGAYEMWRILEDMVDSMRYGYDRYRLPTPGRPLNGVDKRIETIQHEWDYETRNRGHGIYKVSPDFLGLADRQKEYLHEVVTDERVNIDKKQKEAQVYEMWGYHI